MFLFSDFLVFSLTFLAITIVTKALRKKSISRRYPPSLPYLPIVGSLPFIWKFNNIHEYFLSKVDQLGPIFTFRAGNRLFLTLNTKDVIEEALVKNSLCFAGREHFYMGKITNKNNKGIVAKNFSAEFKHYHKISSSVLREFGFGMNRLMETRILEEFEAMDAFIRTKSGKEFNPSEMAGLCTSNIIRNIILGKREDYEKGLGEIPELMTLIVQNICPAMDVAPALLKLLPYFRRKMKLCLESTSRVKRIIAEDVEIIVKSGTSECFVSSYLKKVGPDYDHEQLLHTLKDLIGAGYETTATTLMWMMVFVANNQSVQQRMQKEVDGVIPKYKLPSLDDQPKLPFLEATILEIMRFRTTIPLAVPHLTLSDSEVCGYFIPAQTKVLPNLHAAHMDPKLWKDPNVFRPERFLDEDNNIIGRDRVITFSLGRRSCLGEILARQEMFLIVAGLIKRFSIQPGADGRQIDDTPIVELTMKPQPFTIRMIPRET